MAILLTKSRLLTQFGYMIYNGTYICMYMYISLYIYIYICICSYTTAQYSCQTLRMVVCTHLVMVSMVWRNCHSPSQSWLQRHHVAAQMALYIQVMSPCRSTDGTLYTGKVTMSQHRWHHVTGQMALLYTGKVTMSQHRWHHVTAQMAPCHSTDGTMSQDRWHSIYR